MRSTRDRIRHAILFEIVGLALVVPGGALLSGLPLTDMGVVGAGSAAIATLWNYVYNLAFDHALKRLAGRTLKRPVERVAHAVLFEAGLLVVLIPFIALYLGVSLIEAFLLDVALAAFYVAYAFVFNWAYDRAFPLPEWTAQAG